jgi:hypothetical protein
MSVPNNVGLVQAGEEHGLSTDTGESGQTMRIDMLGGEGGETVIEAPSRPKIPPYVIMLAVLVVASGGVLFGMRKIGMGAGLLADAAPEIIYDVTKPQGNITEDHQRALAQLRGDHTVGQVPVENVQKNPFELDSILPEQVETPTHPVNSETEAQRQARELKSKIVSTYKTLRVQAVVGGSNPVAKVSDGLYRIGDRIGGVFQVIAIHDREVELKGDDGETFLIEMETVHQTWGPGGK